MRVRPWHLLVFLLLGGWLVHAGYQMQGGVFFPGDGTILLPLVDEDTVGAPASGYAVFFLSDDGDMHRYDYGGAKRAFTGGVQDDHAASETLDINGAVNLSSGSAGVLLTVPNTAGFRGTVVRADSGALWLAPPSGKRFTAPTYGQMDANERLIFDGVGSSLEFQVATGGGVTVTVYSAVSQESP